MARSPDRDANPGLARPRADAVRNRAAIVAAAREVYGDHGLDAPLDEIARRAGVGNATLYRHFTSRCTLAAAVFAETLERVIDAARAAAKEDDPWQGFVGHVRFLCELQATNRGLADLLTTEMTGSADLERLRHQAYQGFVALADRAQAAGALRADFVPQDLVLLLMANAGLVQRADAAAVVASRRFTDMTLDGWRAADDRADHDGRADADASIPAAARGYAAAPPRPAALRRAMQTRGLSLGYGEPTTIADVGERTDRGKAVRR